MKKASKIAMAKRTRLGRVLCRLFGDEAGQGMMEYVVLALLLCAAVVGIVMFFGDNIAQMFGVTVKAVAGGSQGIAAAGPDRGKQISNVDSGVDEQLKAGRAIAGNSEQ